jgi:propionate CoA-transferase
VVALPELHWQTLRGPAHDPSLSGEGRAAAAPPPPLPRGARAVIARRAAQEIDRPGLVVNLGVGMPDGVTAVVAAGAAGAPAANAWLTTEAGAWGGTPAAGAGFGGAHDAAAIVPLASMIDVYQGGGGLGGPGDGRGE